MMTSNPTSNVSTTLRITVIILYISFVLCADSYPITFLTSEIETFSNEDVIQSTNDNKNNTYKTHTYNTLPKVIPSKYNKTVEIPHIFVVNLDRAKSRWEHIQEVMKNAELNVERLPGVDGRTLTKQELNTVSTKIGTFFQPRGVIGCYLSHRRFWQYVVDRNYSSSIIFEDDVRLIPGFKNKLTTSLQKLENDKFEYDVIFLGIPHTVIVIYPFHFIHHI